MNREELFRNIRSKATPDEVKALFKIGFRKSLNMGVQFFNSLCGTCRRKAYQNPRMPELEYCDQCKPKYKEYNERLKCLSQAS